MGLHGWQEGRIKPGTFEPLTKRYVEVLKAKLPNSKLIWASSTPVTAKDKPADLDSEINPIIIEHNRMAAKVMAEMNVPVNDFYTLLADKRTLARGERMVQVLNQGRFDPMPVEEQVAVIFAGNQGFLDDLDVHRVRLFGEGLGGYLRSQSAEVLADIRDRGEVTEETEAKLRAAVAAYHNAFAADQNMSPEVAEIEAEVETAEAEA
jgi:hypothetical protein